jgi:hypothetical protein
MKKAQQNYQTSILHSCPDLNPRTAQVRCCAILERVAHGFGGEILLEDGRPCYVKAIFSRKDEECLLVDIYSLRSLHRARTVHRRTLKLCSWSSDFLGTLPLEGRFYQVGAAILRGERLQLRVYFRGRHLHKISAGAMRLEVVR